MCEKTFLKKLHKELKVLSRLMTAQYLHSGEELIEYKILRLLQMGFSMDEIVDLTHYDKKKIKELMKKFKIRGAF